MWIFSQSLWIFSQVIDNENQLHLWIFSQSLWIFSQIIWAVIHMFFGAFFRFFDLWIFSRGLWRISQRLWEISQNVTQILNFFEFVSAYSLVFIWFVKNFTRFVKFFTKCRAIFLRPKNIGGSHFARAFKIAQILNFLAFFSQKV